MPLSPELVAELNLLLHYSHASMQEGIKVHSTASEEARAAVQRLYAKELITQPDGGYLTDLGRDVVEHAQSALAILTSSPLLHSSS